MSPDQLTRYSYPAVGARLSRQLAGWAGRAGVLVGVAAGGQSAARPSPPRGSLTPAWRADGLTVLQMYADGLKRQLYPDGEVTEHRD